ncbi:hypothetical protein BGX33_008655 [Mortierella sp. NVP41]|nr:hypothetical protein BGX33_008655 [Mortierella sp. NVP41]
MGNTTEINPAVAFKNDRSVMYAKRPKVLIVGAGLGGLILGMLLQKADISYKIFERATEVKSLGSAMYFSTTTASLFYQCSLYDDLLSTGNFILAIQMCNEEREVEYKVDFEGQGETFPKDRIHFGKKVLSMDQGGNGVLLRCSDGIEAEGDILVGADGTYSAVRQGLYAKMKKANKLPASDALPLPFSTVCLTGQTQPLSSDEFPDLVLEECQFRNILGDNKPYSSTLTTEQNTVCWGVIQYLDEEFSKENDAFRNSEWGPEAAAAMCGQVKDFPIISDGDKQLTLQDLMDRTPKELISKVMLEEKVLNPAGGVGAVNAIHDAIVLANLINALPLHPNAEEIEGAFKVYKAERLPWVKEAFGSSRVFKTMSATTVMAKAIRYCAKHVPAWVMRKVQVKAVGNRPQISFLPPAEDKGSIKSAHQPSLSAKAPTERKKPVKE